jgi:hypothetical protein
VPQACRLLGRSQRQAGYKPAVRQTASLRYGRPFRLDLGGVVWKPELMPFDDSEQARPSGVLGWPKQSSHARFAAIALWVIPMVVLSILSALRPLNRSVTMSYHDATSHWWTHENLYVGPSGMNYLPHFVVLYSPFHFLPLPACEVLWRLCAAAALGGGLWKMMRQLFPAGPDRPFLWATLVTMPLCMTSLRNGNANALFGGLVLLSVVALLKQRWWAAVLLMTLATALKPLGIVLLMLAPLVYGPVRWRIPIAVAGLVIFPFLFGPTSYVLSQHKEAWRNLQSCAVVSEHRFADINGILRTFGTELGPTVSKLARVFAGGFAALLWLWGGRRLGLRLSALWLHALATGYLMLFNPMNEENSFGILAPALGGWAALFLFDPEVKAGRNIGWSIVVMALSMGLLPNLVRPIFGNHFALFWHPLMAIVFLGLLSWFIARSAPVPAEAPHAAPVPSP